MLHIKPFPLGLHAAPKQQNLSIDKPTMKTSSIQFHRLFIAVAIVIFTLLVLPHDALAAGPHGDSKGRGNSANHRKDEHKGNDQNDHDRQVYYSSRPRSTFVLSLGNGYAGRGYYYGPPNSPYYYQRSEVAFYATREAAPREYYSNEGYHGHSTDAAVQQALARRGYYHGAIDGQIGAHSRRAIYNYQRANGLQATGSINSSLLRSLGI